MPTISIDTTAETAVIRVSGALDIMSSHLLADAIAVAGAEPVVLVSFEECSYLDSTILSVLVRNARLMRERLILLVPKDGYVRRLLEMCGLDEVLHVVSALPERFKGLHLIRAAALTS
ncbi:MAG: STAS domain-containing protein [Candidatus Baltobacteraceae bacterium]|jgi:anti-anti-sigma factor